MSMIYGYVRGNTEQSIRAQKEALRTHAAVNDFFFGSIFSDRCGSKYHEPASRPGWSAPINRIGLAMDSISSVLASRLDISANREV